MKKLLTLALIAALLAALACPAAAAEAKAQRSAQAMEAYHRAVREKTADVLHRVRMGAGNNTASFHGKSAPFNKLD